MAETVHMKKAAIKGSAKKFGARYGRTVKEKFSKIDTLQKSKYSCPFCSYIKVKRVSAGIWNCRKCGAKFTSKAYSVAKTPITAETETVFEGQKE